MKNMSIPNFRVFTFVLVSFLIGIFFSSFFNLNFYNFYWQAFPIFVLTIGIYFLTKKEYLLKLSIYISSAFLFGFLLFAYKNTIISENSLPLSTIHKTTAIIVNYPQIGQTNQQFFVEISDSGKTKRILLTTAKNPEYFYGDKIEIEGTTTKPENFSGFDYINYLKRFGITAEIKNPEITFLSKNNGNKIYHYLFFLRKKFETSVIENLPEPESSLAIGLDIGSTKGFSKEIMEQFSKIGITHIVALSGYNVTIIIVALTDILLGILTARQIFFFSSIIIILFDVLTGGTASVVRASIITLVITFGKTIGRKADMTNLLLLSATVMVVINPFLLRFDGGFALSFIAFSGLVYISPIIEKLFNLRWAKIIPDFIKSVIIETSAAQVAVLPLILLMFGRISIIAPISNILILPIIPVTMLFVFISALIDFALPAVGHLAYLISYFPLKYILFISDKFSKMPLSSVIISNNWQIFFVASYCILLFSSLLFIKLKWAEEK